MRASVRELFELHRELDVRQRAASELQVELRILAGRNPLALDARLHAPDLASPLLGKRVAIHESVRELEVARGDDRVTGDEASLGKRLELPGLRVSAEVRLVAAERSGQRSLVAFRSQPRIDAERPALRCAVAD